MVSFSSLSTVEYKKQCVDTAPNQSGCRISERSRNSSSDTLPGHLASLRSEPTTLIRSSRTFPKRTGSYFLAPTDSIGVTDSFRHDTLFVLPYGVELAQIVGDLHICVGNVGPVPVADTARSR